jgi:hypothetical protein
MKMNTLIALSVVAAAALGACGTRPTATAPAPQQSAATAPTPKVATTVHPYTPGQGTITAVMPTPGSAAAGGGAAGGGAAGGGTAATQRLEIRMDNGAVQYVDVAGKDFEKGNRVVLTQDKLIRKQ